MAGVISANPWQTLYGSLRAILRNGLRSFLTILGIVIGVAAVIAMMAIGAGAKAQVETAFASMGTNLLVLVPGSTSTGGCSWLRDHADANVGRSRRDPT